VSSAASAPASENAPWKNCSTNQIPRKIGAGRIRISKMMMSGIRVTTLACGKSRKYPPMTPAMAPLAPMVGMVESRLVTRWTALAATPLAT
jgi:hypothetical protein